MANGFFGGLSEGYTSGVDQQRQQAQQQFQQQQAQAKQKLEQQVAVQKNINDLIQHASDTVKYATEEGHDASTVAPAVAQLASAARDLAAKYNMDPTAVDARFKAVLARPAAEDDEKHSVVKIGSTPTGGDQYGVLEQNSGTVKPIQSGQPQPPPQAAPAQAPVPAPQAVPVPQAPVQQSSAPAAPDGTPAQRVAMGFPGQTQDAPAPQGPAMPTDMQPGPAAVDYAINNNIHGPEFFKALPPTARNTTNELLDYKIDPDKLSKRVDKSGQSEYTRMLGFAHQASNGDYDPKYYKTMQASLREFTSGGTTSPAAQITAANRAIAHAGTVADSIDKLGQVPGLLERIAKSNTPILSYAAKQLENKAIVGTSEGAALREFLTAANHFTDETTKFYAGGNPAESGRERVLKNFDAATSPLELYSALKQEGTLMHGAAEALQDRFKNAQAGPRYNDALFKRAIPDFPILSENSNSALDRVTQGYIAVKTRDGQTSGGNVPVGNVVDYKSYFPQAVLERQ